MNPRTLPPVVGRVLQLDAVRGLWRNAQSRPGVCIHQRVLDELELTPHWTGSLDAIPAAGPLVVVANHPFGIIEGPILGALLDTVRNDVLFITNSLLAELPELRPRIIAVDPFGSAEARNTGPVRRAITHLQNGGALVVFPAGEVSAMRAPLGQISDAEWNPMAARLALRANAKVLPVYFNGRNRAVFQMAGLLHPGLRTLLLPSELLARRRHQIHAVVGDPVSVERFADADGLTRSLRSKVYALAPRIHHQPIAPPMAPTALERNIGALQPILESGPYRVYLEPAHRIPEALLEIGRLREVTFRAAGEGTGRAADLDGFDQHFHHLFVWHAGNRELAGAYRLAKNPAHSYTATLFHLPKSWRPIAAHGVELGRSFVSAAYQKEFLPLLLLWKGIGHFVKEQTGCRYLYGPVSVSAGYSPASRVEIMAHFSPWRRGFHPRNPLTHALRWGQSKGGTLDGLDGRIRRLEPDGAGLPVLLRQYANLGAEILCWNLDAKFANVVDGLVLLDLEKVPQRQLRRYFGG
ncbi:MAG: lysophospholipid acyltransferase family protein [Acidobacteria bacterium]|nr:lysophospholipid acyltransferase family protein [Acidobacteriota bacterium]